MRHSEVPQEWTWNLTDIYENEAAWQKAFDGVRAQFSDLRALAGTLGDAAGIHAALTLYASMLADIEHIYVWARLNQDLDTADNAAQALSDRARQLYVEFGETASFISPELLSQEEALLTRLLGEPAFSDFRMFLRDTLRQKAHTLDAQGERLLAMSGELAMGPETVFSLLHNADLKLPEIQTEQGRQRLTFGNYSVYLESADRETRRVAYEGMYDAHIALKNTFAGLLSTQVKKDIFFAQARKYDSARGASMDAENVPESVYDALCAAVRRHLPAMQEYLALRGKVLGLDALAPYDLYVPLCKDPGFAVAYDEAKALVLESVAPLGEDYTALLKHAFENRWVDVEETENKCTGAYSMSCYGVHPFVLLNHQNNLESVLTVAHEMGHALNSYLSAKKQPFLMSENCIFLAEVASTANEILLLKHLLKDAQGQKKAYLLNRFLENFRTTVFRQTMFAEFEHQIHAAAEGGEALTSQKLCEMYLQLNRDYYAPAVDCDERLSYEWSRIPHFYYNFYVYKYATSFCAAVALTEAIEQEGMPAVQRYLEFLAAGTSDDPVELLLRAGVDARDPGSVERALLVFDGLVGELRAALEV